MHLSFGLDGPTRLRATLRDGPDETVVTAADGRAAGRALLRAVDEARATGHGECFWHELTGQYWWIFRREDARVEMVVLWSRGTVTGWQHVFRAVDEIGWLTGRVRDDLAGLVEP